MKPFEIRRHVIDLPRRKYSGKRIQVFEHAGQLPHPAQDQPQ
jgi:hypothetical protein